LNDSDFLSYVSERLSDLPGIQAVALGGSRAQGTERPDSDWDFAIYYRDAFNTQEVRDLGWEGEVSEIGEWGGGVFNGGAWLELDGRNVDVHYRDLESIDHEMEEVSVGRFRIEPLMFHLAGIPTYLVVAELALGQLLRGDLPHPSYPPLLKERAPQVWWDRAGHLFEYAKRNYAARSELTQCVGMVVQAACCAAHAVLAAHGEWITNEKSLLAKADLLELDQILTTARPSSTSLDEIVYVARDLCLARLTAAG
jgi:predicted nucleotidyltransferase